jgi:hypothetical protein
MWALKFDPIRWFYFRMDLVWWHWKHIIHYINNYIQTFCFCFSKYLIRSEIYKQTYTLPNRKHFPKLYCEVGIPMWGYPCGNSNFMFFWNFHGNTEKNFSVVFIKSYKFDNEHRSIYNNPFHFTVSSERWFYLWKGHWWVNKNMTTHKSNVTCEW